MRMMLNNVRISFPVLGKPERYKNDPSQPLRYSATFLVPEGSAQKKAIDAAIRTLAKEAWGAKADQRLAGVLPDAKACCWQDGARKEYDGYEGQWSLSAGRNAEKKGPPVVIDRDKTPLFDKASRAPTPGREGRVYAGCYVNAQVELYVQNPPNMGVRCELLGVQFASDGDAFGGGAPASDDEFADLGEGAEASDLV